MMHRAPNTFLALALVLAMATVAAHADAPSAPGIGGGKPASPKGGAKSEEAKAGDDKPFDQVVKDMAEIKGLFTFYGRGEDNKLYLEIKPEQLDRVFLFTATVDRSSGERGFYASMMGKNFPFTFHRVGKSIQWIAKNTSFTAAAGTPQARTVERSFTDAILATVKLQAKPHADRKSLLIDAAELFAARDYPGFANGLSTAYSPTSFSFDKDKSATGAVKAFPENVVVDVSLNFQTDNFKSFTTTLVDPRSVPIVVKYQISSLPVTGYKTRLADDRVGYNLVVQQDFSSDHPQTPYVRYIQRRHLEKQDPNAALSAPKQPIVYWLENTIPLEYRDAVREGILLWNKAFERIGFKDAIVVKQMPDSADWDPADVRYNTIRWFASVDATFAIGPRRVNPFTGEILDADIGVSEGIIRFARRFAEEYLAPVARNDAGLGSTGGAAAGAASEWIEVGGRRAPFAWANDPQERCAHAEGLVEQAVLGFAVLEARGELTPALEQRLMHEYVLQVVAHEIGHTLGLRHNFHASTMLGPNELMDSKKVEELGQSASMMDYNPLVVAAKGEPQGHFVPVTLGPYDYWAIEYAYKPIAGDESGELAKIASRGTDPELQYGTDEDALGTFSPLGMDPLVSLFDASSDPLDFFRKRIEIVYELWGNMETRLAKPGEGYQVMRRAAARSFGDLARSLVTSSKFVGGVYTHRDHVGDPQGRVPFEPVPAAKQREALDLLSKYAFGQKAFVVPASLLNKLAAERNPSLDPAYWAAIRLDFPWHNQVIAIQSALLARMYHPVTLGRMLDNELRFAKGETAFRMADLFDGLNASIWSELDRPAGTTITSMRRNLQREHLRHLIRMALREGTTMVDAGLGPVPVALPEDATTLARASLMRVQAKMRAKLFGKIVLETTTRAHLQESAARINQALSASMQRSVD